MNVINYVIMSRLSGRLSTGRTNSVKKVRIPGCAIYQKQVDVKIVGSLMDANPYPKINYFPLNTSLVNQNWEYQDK